MSESRKAYWGGQHSLDNSYGKLVLERVRLDRGGYTSSGRYFGIGQPLYRVMNDSSEDGVVDFYIRAADRKAAIAEVRGMYPQAKIPGGGGGAPRPKRTRTTRHASTRSTSTRGTRQRHALRRLHRMRKIVRKRGWGIMRGSHARPRATPTAHVTKVVRPGVTRMTSVKNLGWFFRKARTTVIKRFDMWQSNDGWEMFVDFEDGSVFQTHYASLEVFKHVMGRQRSLRGVHVTVHHENGSKTDLAL